MQGWRARVRELMKKIDIFGVPIRFTLNNKYQQKSIFGAIISLLIITFFMLFSLQCLWDIINHNDFLIYSQEVYSLEAPFIDFSWGKMNMAISFSDVRLNDGSYFKLELFQGVYTNINGTTKKNKIAIATNNCRVEQFRDDLKANFLNLDSNEKLGKYLCPETDQNFSLRGNLKTNDFEFLNIKISQCQETSTIKCVSQEKIDQVFRENGQKIYLNVFLSNNIVNLHDFKSPISSFFDDKLYVILDREYYKEKNFYFNQMKVLTDDNLLKTEFLEEISTYSYESEYEESSIKLINITNSTVFAALYLRSGSISKFDFRSSQKFNKYVSYIGGYWSVIYFFFKIVGKSYNTRKTNLKIANKLYDFYDEDKIIHKKSKEKHLSLTFGEKLRAIPKSFSIKLHTWGSKVKSQQKKEATLDPKEVFFTKINEFLQGKKAIKLLSDFSYYISRLIRRAPPLKSETQKILRKKASLAMIKDLDIVHLLKKIKDIEKVKKVLFTSDQKFVFEFFGKTLISPNKDGHVSSRDSKLFIQKSTLYPKKKANENDVNEYFNLFQSYSLVKNDESPEERKLNSRILELVQPEIRQIFDGLNESNKSDYLQGKHLILLSETQDHSNSRK